MYSLKEPSPPSNGWMEEGEGEGLGQSVGGGEGPSSSSAAAAGRRNPLTLSMLPWCRRSLRAVATITKAGCETASLRRKATARVSGGSQRMSTSTYLFVYLFVGVCTGCVHFFVLCVS